MIPEHELIASEIRSGMKMADERLIAALSRSTRAERFEICRSSSLAFAEVGEYERSRVLADRAYNLWDGEAGFADYYIGLIRSGGNVSVFREVTKRAGILMAEHGDLMAALRYFNLHHYAYQSLGYGDHYLYDHDVIKAVERLAGIEQQSRRRSSSAQIEPARPLPARPLRVAYLIFGANHTNSVLIRLLLEFARYHRRQEIECSFFSPDARCEARDVNTSFFSAVGTSLIVVDSEDEQFCLLETEERLREAKPDVVVSVAALADYRQYYLFAASAADVRVALCYGPPAQYVPPTADWTIAGSRHPLLDCPCDGEVIPIEVELPKRPECHGILPGGVIIPENAILLLAAGRSEKFLCRDYWEAILAVVSAHPNIYFVACGLMFPPAFIDELRIGEFRDRIHVLGWLEDYRPLLARADVVIDTYPSGGGLTIMDSMAFGIPVLSFANDYLKSFDQTNWSLAEEILCFPELIVGRGDWSAFQERLANLVEDGMLRQRLGEACRKHAEEKFSNPRRMVRRFEESYFRLYQSVSRPSEGFLRRWRRRLGWGR